MTDRNGLLCAVLLLVLASMAGHAQSTGYGPWPVPDAPKMEPRLCPDGQPKLTGSKAKLIGECPRENRVKPRWDGTTKDHLWSFGDGERTLHPDKVSWGVCLGMEAGAIASTVWAVQRHKTSHEEAHSEYPVMAVETGLNVFMFKTMSPLFVVGTDTYRMVHYFRAGWR